jgi:hypothetical protein
MSLSPDSFEPYQRADGFVVGQAVFPSDTGRSRWRALSVLGLVLAIIPCLFLPGFVLSIIALVQNRGSRDSGTRTMSIIGTVIGALWVVGSLLFWLIIGHTYPPSLIS